MHEPKVKKRDRLKVIYDILNLIRNNYNSIKPTPLMRKSNLSSQNVSEYMRELMQKGFVKEITDKKERRHYTLTDKGFEYLTKYKAIREFINEFEL